MSPKTLPECFRTHILEKNSLHSQPENSKEPFHYSFNWSHYFLRLSWGLLSMALSPWMADRRAQLCNAIKFSIPLSICCLDLGDVVASTPSVKSLTTAVNAPLSSDLFHTSDQTLSVNPSIFIYFCCTIIHILNPLWFPFYFFLFPSFPILHSFFLLFDVSNFLLVDISQMQFPLGTAWFFSSYIGLNKSHQLYLLCC